MNPCCQERTRPELAMCSCGHMVLVHYLSPKKKRGYCTHMDEKGQCPCPSPR